ncbi:cable pilus major pilin CblA [Comamonas sp. AG1104]|uniref:cable pilus major pilin CblA n=1 Tax=Comamonas sp. AG1104 TaxID=2183900 RepID=UPI000E0C5C29|nr:cable pilus major pilin CblA [Comamonas sp. AG1104]RDI15518.1 CS1 type fimbrial major subunit [Comamonas sp. AG1104]
MLKFVPIAAAALMAMSAHAVQKDITVTATVDTTLEMLSADGSPLPTTMRMQYLPGSGLQPAVVNTKIFTNDTARDVQIRLASSPSLTNQTNPSADDVALTVKLGGNELTTTASTLTAATTFPGTVAEGSVVLPLSIAQTTVAPITASGSYQGLVSLVLTQAAAAVTP